MKLQQLGSNMMLLKLDNVEILFSYETPVAGFDHGYFRTDAHFSQTTSKHINKYLGGVPARTIPQAEIEKLAGQ